MPMAKIRISYMTRDELREVCHYLKPIIKKIHLQPAKGQYKRAYLDLKETSINGAIPSDK